MPKRKAEHSGWTYRKRQKIPINLGDKEENYSEEDQISQLPDAILISILSLLGIREAARTCVLSKRWVFLWKQITTLNFDDIDALSKPQKKRKRVKTTSSYNWVKVLQLHQGPSLDEFQIHSSSPNSSPSSSEIDNWIEFAMWRRVQGLEIDFYVFLDKLFRSPFSISCIKSLKHLSLSFVNITGELVEHFLSYCELLEHLCVSCSDQLVNLKVAESTRSIITPFLSVKSCIPQLVTLNLHMNLSANGGAWLPEFPELTSLKDLSLSVIATDRLSLLFLTKLIERSPFLHGFTLKLGWARDSCKSNMQKVNKCPHQCLKVVKFSGFVGSIIDTDLAMYFTENAVALETFIVNLKKVVVEESALLSEFVTTQKKLRATRKRALQIGGKLPPGAELVIV
ncbi:hypothetical protein PRUPE_1G495700 [Prunus persica]|uniref:Uncharacterized protein n=1 Tax=Prunus persica TaxID=3760 RepID=A0A251RFK8_PRUPE|nr:hypothetical protein PRUPE_1G495700 [Prunus persica]